MSCNPVAMQFYILCNPIIYFNMEKKLWRHISFSSPYFYYYRKHPNNEDKICPLLSFMTDSQYIGTIHIGWNLNECYYYLTSNKSEICQIDANFTPFQSLNMLPLHIRLEHLKLTYYSLISIFCIYFFKTCTLCFFTCICRFTIW